MQKYDGFEFGKGQSATCKARVQLSVKFFKDFSNCSLKELIHTEIING